MKSYRRFRSPSLVLAATLTIVLTGQPGVAGVLGNLAHLVDRPVAASNDLDARQGAMHERLRDAMEAGRLTDSDMHSINDQLQKVAAQEAAYKAKNGELSGSQTNELQMEVDRISKELEADLTERKGGPVDVVALRNQLGTRLSDALAVQKLTQDEYNTFNQELASIDKQIAAATGADGKLQTNDQVRIALQLDNLSQRFTAGEHQRQADMSAIDKRKDELRSMIREGVAEGQLTEDEVDDLRQQLYNFEDKEKKMASIGRPLTGDEELNMALELERFGAEIRARMDNGTNVKITERTVDHRRAALDQTFANALFSGDLSVAEAGDFKKNLDQISTEIASLRSQNGGTLQPGQIRSLLIEVEKLKGRFSRLTYNRPKPWSGVDGLVNEIKQKIAVAGVKNQLSSQEVDDLQSKIADVLVAKSNERNVQGFVTTDSAIKLESEIAALSDEVTKIIADRSVVSMASVQQHQLETDHAIAIDIDSGKLTTAEAPPIIAEYKKALANIAKLKSGAIAPDSGAMSAVTVQLANILVTLKNARHDNTAPLVSIDQLKGEVDREITQRGYSGKLTPNNARALRARYNAISQTEKNGRATATGLDALTANSVRLAFTDLLKNAKDFKASAATASSAAAPSTGATLSTTATKPTATRPTATRPTTTAARSK
jgi:hypothetical protein